MGTEVKLFDGNMTEPESLECLGYQVSYLVRRHPDKPHTEDALGIFRADKGLVVAVADGFGGHPAGEQAAKCAIDTLMKALQRKHSSLPLKEIITNSFEEANRHIITDHPGSATTLVVAEISRHEIRFYNAGDSIGFVFGQRGKKKRQTMPHKDPESALYVENYLGSQELRIEITTQSSIAEHDRIILASDGVADNYNFAHHHSFAGAPDDVCRSILDESLKRMTRADGKPDDLTLVVLGHAA